MIFMIIGIFLWVISYACLLLMTSPKFAILASISWYSLLLGFLFVIIGKFVIG